MLRTEASDVRSCKRKTPRIISRRIRNGLSHAERQGSAGKDITTMRRADEGVYVLVVTSPDILTTGESKRDEE